MMTIPKPIPDTLPEPLTSSPPEDDAAHARSILRDAVAVEVLISEGAYPEGVAIRAIMADGARRNFNVMALDFSAAVQPAPPGKLVMTLGDGSQVTWSRPMAPSDRVIPWAAPEPHPVARTGSDLGEALRCLAEAQRSIAAALEFIGAMGAAS